MIVCFYGHKGGAGRSAAVANVAPALSSAGYRVLVVDFDLEAPGVHRFFGIPDAACAGGVVDLVEQHAARLAAGGDVELPAFPEELLLEPRFGATKTPDGELAEEVVRDRILGPREIGTTTRFETGVRVLPAGRFDPGYRARVAAIDWSARWQDPAWRAFFGWFKLELESRAEVVFLDARAGVTELAALCLFGLADRVVLLTPPTSQGLDGAVATARSLRAAGRGPGDHGTLLVPSRVSKDADREHYSHWLRAAKLAVRDTELLPVWTETKGRSQPERAAEDMLERFLLPELAVHAVGEPLVALRMIERGISQDDLQDRYAHLAGTIQRWAADGRREAAALEGLQAADEVQARIEAARGERRLDELPALYGRLAEVKLESMTTWDHAREAAELARQGASAAALLGDEATELRLRVLEGRALLEAMDPEAAEPVLEAAARRLVGRPDEVLLSLEARARWGQALVAQEKDEQAVPILQTVWEEADACGVAAREWSVRARGSAGYEPGDLLLLRKAWELALDGPRDLAVSAGGDLASWLPAPEDRAIAEHCRGLARQAPRDPQLIAGAEFAWLQCQERVSVNEWTRVIDLLGECLPPPVDLALAYWNRAVHQASGRRAADMHAAMEVWRMFPRLMARGYASAVRAWIMEEGVQTSATHPLLGALVELRGLVELGAARRASTQATILGAHVAFAESCPSVHDAMDVAHAFDLAVRARPWHPVRGGWRPGIGASSPLILAVAARNNGDTGERARMVRTALASAAAHRESALVLGAIHQVYLLEQERHSLLTEALTLPDACPEFKAAIQSQLNELDTPT